MGRDLSELRREIDAIDDQLHTLLKQRTKIVEEVRLYKKDEAVKIRPAREAEIIYRLFAQHEGKFPRRELFRIWRELIVATLSLEGPFSTGVFVDEDGNGFWDMARDQYGSYTPLTAFPSTRRIIEAVQKQEVTVGVVPIPARREEDPWWRRMAFEGADVPRVIARLPFVSGSNARNESEGALVISPVPQEATGRDRTYIVIESAQQLKPSQIDSVLKDVGLELVFSTETHDVNRPEIWQILIEVDDFVAPDDGRLKTFKDAFEGAIQFAITIGGYALPISADELD